MSVKKKLKIYVKWNRNNDVTKTLEREIEIPSEYSIYYVEWEKGE